MAIIDNTLAAQVPQFNAMTPLAEVAKYQAVEQERAQAKFKQDSLELGSEMRGLQPFVNTPEFAGKWRETADRMLQKGIINEQMHQQWANAPSPLLMKSIISKTDTPEMAFNKQEALRAQGNSDRNYLLQKRAQDRADANANETETDAADERAAAAAKYGLKPGTPEYNSYVLGGGYTPAAGGNKIEQDAEARKRLLVQQGQDPNTPQNLQYINTGKYPREDAQPLTATDKKAIQEADEGVLSANTAIDALRKAKELSPKAMGFKGAGYVASVGSVLGNETSQNTVDLDNTVTTNALSQLKAIFGGAPTEGERKILLDIQGSSSQPDAVRQKIYDRAIALAEKRLKFNEDRANELRGGTFYKSKAKPDAAVLKQQAKDAIEAGAPRDAVIKRLKEQGVTDVSGI